MTNSYVKSEMPVQSGSAREPIFVVLAGIRSRENVGSIFRTADAAGVSKVFLCGITPCPPHEKISKTALGAQDSVSWEYYAQTGRLLGKLKKEGYKILILEQTPKSKNIFKYTHSTGVNSDLILDSKLEAKISPKYFSKNVSENPFLGLKNRIKNGQDTDRRIGDKKSASPGLVLVLGNEVSGISKNLFNYATHVIQIPMYGTKESLNVAVAFGIAVYSLKAKEA